MADLVPNAILIAIALVCAWHFAEGKWQAVACAGMMGIAWVEYVLSWTPYSLHFGLKAIGIHLSNAETWMLTDAATSTVVVLIAVDFEWAGVLWLLLALQVFLHGLYILGGADFDQYSRYLDYFFWGQIMCFVFWGGPNALDRVYSAGGRLWYAAHSRASKAAQA